ncbi:MAG: hypothetical protein FWC67_00520 [Defluviitaleaceae bacterium]|nr:hypothetical protein [Defluviitaleaceae bacterium]
MQTEGFVNDGIIVLEKDIPTESSKVTVIFHPSKPQQKPEKKRPREEARAILKELRGCLKNGSDFDYEKLKEEYLEEKYGPFD